MPDSEDSPVFTISEDSLVAAGFTSSGKKRSSDTSTDYVKELYEKSKLLADASRGQDLPREVTHEHVRSAARILAVSFGRPNAPWWALPCQVLEYLATAGVGLGTGQLDQPWGIKISLGCFIVGVLLLVLRLNKGKAE